MASRRSSELFVRLETLFRVELLDQVMVVAKDAKPTPAIQSALNRSYNCLSDALGRKAITNLGPGENQRDAVVEYYDAQVNKFVR